MLTASAGTAGSMNSHRKGSTLVLLLLVALKVLGSSQNPAIWTTVTVAAWTSWATFAFYRTSRADPTTSGDLLALLAIELWDFPWKRPSLERFYCTAVWCSDPITWEVLALLGTCAVLAGIGVRWERRHQESHLKTIPEIEPFDDDFLQPMLLPCRTTHTRLFPKRHSFSYSYLLVGVPVGWRGTIGSLLSVDTQILSPKERRKGWFHISGADYLDRDGSGLDLKAKVASYLQSQGENPGDFPHVYLVTAPRFLGYSFNPVSFWYLYSELRLLKAMILEVNNTFDERRMYFLKPSTTGNGNIEAQVRIDAATGLSEADKELLSEAATKTNAQSTVFSDAWSKDFHVSPFNDRVGSYSLAAHDPLKNGSSKWLVDNTVVLKSLESRAKLVARIFADGNPVDPQVAGQLNLARFMVGWCWVGFVTFPRIVKEASTLYFSRGLPVWFRPEVAKSSIGRHPTSSEWILEPFFRLYLEHLVKRANQPLSVVYEPPSGMGPRHVMKTTDRHTQAPPPSMEFRVLTPAFYSRFVHYAHTSEAIDRECLCTDELNRTLWINRPEFLSALLYKDKATTSEGTERHQKRGETALERLRWAMLRKLRCSPPTPSYPTEQLENTLVSKQDIRSMPYSGFDLYIRGNLEDSWIYRRNVTALFLAQRLTFFLAQRLTFGLEGAISILDLSLRLALLLVSHYYPNKAYEITRAASPNWLLQAMVYGVLELLLTNLVHLWALLK